MVQKKPAKFTALFYIIPILILMLAASGFYNFSNSTANQEVQAEKLLSDAVSQERYLSTDDIADKIINQDPSFKLIDLRDKESFSNYAIPNAINIPLPELFNEEHKKILDQDKYDIVFYSNNNLHSDQAWTVCSRLGYKNLFVLQGGINHWFETIINPKAPTEDMPEKEFELYSSRKAASMYFGVKYPDAIPEPVKRISKPNPKKPEPVKKKKKRLPEGGC